MLIPSTQSAPCFFKFFTTCFAPVLLKPSRLISARSFGKRKMRGFGLPGCASLCHSSNFDESKSERAQSIRSFTVFVETRREAHRIRERQSEPLQFSEWRSLVPLFDRIANGVHA